MKGTAILGLSVAIAASVAPLLAQETTMFEHVTTSGGPLREVRTARETARGPAFGSVSRRTLEAPIEDVWQLFTDPERLREWHPAPVTGELRHHSMRSDDWRVRIYVETAVVTAQAWSEAEHMGRAFSTHERSTSVFLKRDGRWTCVLTQLTPISSQ